MDDLISRQAAIEALNEYFSRIGKLERRGLTKGEEAISLDTVGAIKTLPPVQPEPPWIPVKKEMPEKPGYYITSSEYGGVTVDFYYDYFWNAQKNAYKVIAWMPLPKIYKPNK